MNSKSKVSVLLVVLWLGALLPPRSGFTHIPLPPKEPTEIGRRAVNVAVPDFKLIDQDGKAFQFVNARGKLILATFVFTTCPDVCPLFTAHFAGIQRTLDEGERNKLLGEAQRIIARDAVNGFLFQLPKLGVWNADLEGLWENSPIQANDLTEARWRR